MPEATAAMDKAAGDPAIQGRRDLALRPDTGPGMLYFLAQDPAPAVREAVAANAAAPGQANMLLAGDAEESVRRSLGLKLARLLPDLDPKAQAELYRTTLQALETLVADQALGVRIALATTLADIACAPPALCRKLARDRARAVAEPMLHYCAALSDEDLVALITAGGEPWAAAAIARRSQVAGPVSDAIWRVGGAEATGILLDNDGAVIAPATLSRIVEASARQPGWRAALRRRPDLPPALAGRLAAFVDEQIRDGLDASRTIDAETTADVVGVARRRLDFQAESRPGEAPAARAARLLAAGTLNDAAIGDGLSWGDLAFVRAALALLADTRIEIVDHILDARSPKGVTALAWRCGLGMRCAIQIQARAARIAPRDLLNARNGVDYPLTAREMLWHLEFYGIGGGGGPASAKGKPGRK